MGGVPPVPLPGVPPTANEPPAALAPPLAALPPAPAAPPVLKKTPPVGPVAALPPEPLSLLPPAPCLPPESGAPPLPVLPPVSEPIGPTPKFGSSSLTPPQATAMRLATNPEETARNALAMARLVTEEQKYVQTTAIPTAFTGLGTPMQ